MQKIDRKDIFIKIGQFVGDLEMNYGFNKDSNIPFTFGFKVDTLQFEKGKFEQILKPGQFHPSGVFYESPITCFYVQILEIRQINKDSYHYGLLKSHLKLFNKDFSQSKDIQLEVKAQGSSPLDFMRLSPLINFLNKYVENKNEINRLDIDKLINNSFQYWRQLELHELITKLKIEFYADSRNWVGKDNHFWTDTVVSNINDNPYFKNLLIAFFNEQYSSCKFVGGVLTSRIESDYGWCASHAREKFENACLELEIRTRIAIWMGQNFNDEEYQFSEYEIPEESETAYNMRFGNSGA